MRIFDGFNEAGKPCPICGTNDNKKTALIPVSGTRKNKICKAVCIHVGCLFDIEFTALSSSDKKSIIIVSEHIGYDTEEELF